MGEKRRTGWEWKVAGWGLRHPLITSAPAAAATGVAYLGPTGAGITIAGAAALAASWYRGHPDSWDTLMAPRIRAIRRRWLSRTYLGPFWSRVMEECGLVTVHRVTGEIQVPRIVRLRSYTTATETIRVRMLVGQTLKSWLEASEALAVGLNADRIAIEKVSPRILSITVQHGESFPEVIVPPEVPTDSELVDPARIWLGETEEGADWIEPVVGQHWLISGASGSGKNSITWGLLRDLAPLIRDGLVRLYTVNPKATEMRKLHGVSYRYAENDAAIALVIKQFWEDMQERKAVLAERGLRTFVMSRETPLCILLIDELGAVTGYGAKELLRAVRQPLALILSQARSLGGTVIGALQEPSKEVLPDRDLFTRRVQLRATSAVHADMTLGDDMHIKGALADQIPNLPESAGIGYVVRERSRTPMQVRAAYANDADIDDIVRVAGWPMSEMASEEETANEEVTANHADDE